MILNVTPPNVDAGIGGALNCNMASLVLDGTNSSTGSNFIYQWTTPNGNIVSAPNGLNPTVNAAGTYTLLVTNTNNGCTAISDVVVEQTSSLDVSLANQTNVSCFGNLDGTASIDVDGGAGGYTYLWSNGNTTNTISNVAAGSYTVMVNDADNCSINFTVNITEPMELAGSISNINVSCNGLSDGQATATLMGANTPTYLWSNGITNNTITNLAAGTYTVTLSDDNDCPFTQEVTISEPPAIVGTIENIVNVECTNSTDGAVTVSGQGGVGTLTYLWSIGVNTPTVNNLSAGTYTVSITDENFCTNALEVTIEANDSENPIPVAQNITLSLNQNGIVEVDVNMIDNGSSDNCEIANMMLDITQFDCNDLGENEVTLTVVDLAGNTSMAIAMVTIIDDIAPVLDFCPENIVSNSCNGVEYTMPSAFDNCLVPAPMLISGLESGAVFPEGVTEVLYRFEDQSGNHVLCSFTVTVENNLALVVDNVTNANDNQTNGSIDVSISGGTSPYTYSWTSNGQMVSISEDLTDVPPGDYELEVVDATGCIIASEIITVDNMVNNENVLATALENFIQVNPNPTSGMIFIDVNLPEQSNVQLNIYDITGRSLMTVPTQNISQRLLELDLSKFTSGVYILKIKVDDDLLAKRLILQK